MGLITVMVAVQKWTVITDKYKNIGFSYDDVFFGIDNLLEKMIEGTERGNK